jgi:hypothetical protein
MQGVHMKKSGYFQMHPDTFGKMRNNATSVVWFTLQVLRSFGYLHARVNVQLLNVLEFGAQD